MDPRRRRRRVLSPEQKWQTWLEVISGELTQADAARKVWGGRERDHQDPQAGQGCVFGRAEKPAE